ncbi:MAG: Fe-S cluster protein [Methanocorpusculum parvum]|nr:Fe-S cluster protein [Methanocorpusculum parvum]
MVWTPPGKDCGACGAESCEAFMSQAASGLKNLAACPYYHEDVPKYTCRELATSYSGTDVCNAPYDFVISALPNEPSARKILLPFRPDLVEREEIKKGDIVLGRPAGAGCPVQHVIRVIEADHITGLITGHVVGPAFSRDNTDIIDLKMYHMIGFEGVARVVARPPQFGVRHPFLPGFCMMDRTHTGIVNMILEKSYGLHVRVEGIVIL